MSSSQQEQLAIIGEKVQAQRWVWFDDWRSWAPVFFPVAGQGEWPMYPTVYCVKKELVKSWSYLGAAFKDGTATAKIQVFSTSRVAEAVAINEDPTPHRELPDDWFINEKTALIVAVDWDSHLAACNFQSDNAPKDDRGSDVSSKKHTSSCRSSASAVDDKKDKKDKHNKKDKLSENDSIMDPYGRGYKTGFDEGLEAGRREAESLSGSRTDASWSKEGESR